MMEDMMALHRSKLETDRQALRQINRTRSPIVPSRESLEAQKNVPRRRIAPRSPPNTGLQLGGYEQHQKQLKAEANKEYNKFLDKQKLKTRFQPSPLIIAEEEITNKGSPRKENEEVSSPPQNDENLKETYEQLLERKREIERRYRCQLGDYTAAPTKENAGETPRKVHFGKDDDLSRAVKRLGALSAYDRELEDWNTMRSGKTGRGIKSAHEERGERVLTAQDRSKSVPHEVAPTARQKSTVQSFLAGGSDLASASENRKKKYAEELRIQMDEQRRAKIKEKEEYIGSPSVKRRTGPQFSDNPNKSSSKPSPLEKAEDNVRQRLNTKFEALSPDPAVPRTARKPPSPTLESPGRLPHYPTGGYFPPPGYMYPPYMYPSYMMPQQQPGMMPQQQPGMMPQQQMVQPGMMPMGNMMGQPQMMNNMQQPMNNTQYDPYQYYGLDRQRADNSRERVSKERPATPNKTKHRNIESVKSPAITRITDIGAANESQKPVKGALDPLEYARELKRQVEERGRDKVRKKEEQERYDRKMEEEAANYNPWGRGGAGAPLKDAQGQSVANRAEMKHKAQDPIALQKEQQSRVVAALNPQQQNTPSKEGNPQHFGRVHQITGTPQEEDPVKEAAKQDYKSFLEQQIEERARQKESQKELERLEDEKELARIEGERLRLKDEFEKELQERKKKDEDQKKTNEDLKRAAEERRQDQERRTAEAKQKQEVQESRKQREEEERQDQQLEQRLMQPAAVDHRGRSPPVPTLANKQDTPPNPNRQQSIVIPTHLNKQHESPNVHRESIVIPTHANREPDPVRESIVIPTHANRHTQPVPKLDFSRQPETQGPESDLRPSDRRPPSIIGRPPSDGPTTSGDVTKDHVMSQLSALRTQLNRLQNVKRDQNQLGRPAKMPDEFDTELERTAKRRNPAGPVRADYDNMSVLSQDLRERYELFNGADYMEDKFRNIQVQDRDSLDGQCSSEFVACTPEHTQFMQPGRRSTQNNRYKRPPSGTSIQSFDVQKISQRNEERLRRLENMHSGRIFKEQSPDLILDAFLSDARPQSEASLDCETSYKPAF